MKAVTVALFFLCINAGLFVVGAVDIWTDAYNPGGATPQEMENHMVLENAEGLPSQLSGFIGNKLTIGIIVAGILIGSVSTLVARVTTPKAVGILAFVTIYSVLLGNLSGLMGNLNLPTSLITVVTGFQYFWLVAAVIQMATGTSWRDLQ